jgi:hypothetical protein
MPKGPQGQKRPADTVSAAVMVGRIAIGEVKDAPTEPKGLAGAKARAESLSPSERKKIAKAAAEARWSVL